MRLPLWVEQLTRVSVYKGFLSPLCHPSKHLFLVSALVVDCSIRALQLVGRFRRNIGMMPYENCIEDNSLLKSAV